jgi:hypothetical protein
MSAVTIDEAWPGFGSAFTVAELDRMPDDGHRYALAATSTQPITVAHPFEVTIVPANLTRGLTR